MKMTDEQTRKLSYTVLDRTIKRAILNQLRVIIEALKKQNNEKKI